MNDVQKMEECKVFFKRDVLTENFSASCRVMVAKFVIDKKPKEKINFFFTKMF